MSEGMVRKWVRAFKDGRTNTHDEERSGRPSVITEDLVQNVGGKVRENRRFTISSLTNEFPQVSKSTLYGIVTEYLNYLLLTNSLSRLMLQNLRSDNHFIAILADAGEMAPEINADKSFESIPRHRIRRRKRQFDYENLDEPIIDTQEKYRIEFFYHLVDNAVNSLEQRFSQLQHYNSYFCFPYHIHELKDVSSSVILTNQKYLKTILTDGESTIINILELRDEISVVCSLLEKKLPTYLPLL
ncbi:hypothetical protein AVEN_269373-1 [Araneus ventricosus]|uniref:Uncharacterized protein n=1 Tax=Araneus ventricosus TaxID=182803 RepID=A0A4Y2VNN0_ARAVE|nr:hypothetical protein AVEN_254455-1 [Araneus ventricosus]GBO26935.1 hypothetical protein AVEN_269373-1 [Araneus ventricosus]